MDNYNAQPGEPGFTRTGENLANSENEGSDKADSTRVAVSQKAGELRDKVTDLGRRTLQSVDHSRQSAANALDSAATSLHSGGDRVSEAAHSAARKIQGTADYVRQTDLRAMGVEVTNLVKRYPGQSLAVAAALGFLLARSLRTVD
jgi:ElaB/YqjD/DUF883 family membrane-anchored ribosome-binding protein